MTKKEFAAQLEEESRLNALFQENLAKVELALASASSASAASSATATGSASATTHANPLPEPVEGRRQQ